MLRIIKNKKGQVAGAIAGAGVNQGAAKPKKPGIFGRFRDGQIDPGELAGSLVVSNIVNKTLDTFGKRIQGSGNLISLEKFLHIVLWPLKILINLVILFIAFIGKHLLLFAVAVIIVGVVGFFGPTVRYVAAENDLRTADDWYGFVKEDIVHTSDILSYFEKAQQRWEYRLYGQFAETEEAEDDTKYGIYMTSRDIGPLKELYAPNEEIIISAYPKAEVLSAGGVAEIECFLEESMGPPTIYPSNTIPISSLPGSSITCVFDPIGVNDDPQREATITIKYPFSTSSTLPVSVMDRAKYDELFKLLMVEEGMDIISAKKEIAKSVKVDYDEIATPNENTPVVVSAEITEYQPLVKKAGYTASLLVNVINQGEGTIQEITSMRIDPGDLGLRITEIGIDVSSGGIVDPQYLHSIGEINDLQHFLFGVETGNFQLDSNEQATTSRISVEVSYIYNISATTDVKVASCRTFPDACDIDIADAESNEEAT